MKKPKYYFKSKSKFLHDSSTSHVTGETKFIDDIESVKNELIVTIVTSEIAYGEIKTIDFKDALKIDGVESVITAKDIKKNLWGAINQDQPLLADTYVNYVGEPILIFATTNKEIITKVKKSIKIKIKELTPVLTIEQSIKRKDFFDKKTTLRSGDIKASKKNSKNIIKSSFRNGGQEHFYLESHAAIAYPEENGEIIIHSSSQHPTEVQHVVAKALGINFNKVVSTVKRMGGGFGGKESQASHIAALAALIAFKTKRVSRLVLDKDQDMEITGKRHPFKTDYEVGFDDKGKIDFLKANLYADGGSYLDLTPAILQRAMFHIDNAYFLENAEINGYMCKTNYAANTAFRGFGGPQGAAIIEHIIEEISQKLNIDALKVRKLNCYGKKSRNTTHYGQVIKKKLLPEVISKLQKNINYEKITKEINTYNKKSLKGEKSDIRGYALTPCKFGISFTSKFLNQGNALVNIHSDGTIQVSTGATEMGQGVNTKIQLVVCECFGLTPEKVKIMPTSTEKNHNTSATAASSGSDINSKAAELASLKIKERLRKLALFYFQKSKDFEKSFSEFKPSKTNSKLLEEIYFDSGNIYLNKKSKTKKISFNDLVSIAYFNRVSLGDYAFFKTPSIHFDPKTGKGNPFLYYTNGAAFSEVSIDKLTGELKVLKTNIVMDLGRPMIDGIDYGQVAGGFIQSLGWVTSEELVYSPKGKLSTHSPTTYKIPSIGDTPREFTIDFLENDLNIMNVRKSKAVGEPPFLLGLSVFCAIKNALYNLDCDSSTLKIPATSEEILKHIYPEHFNEH